VNEPTRRERLGLLLAVGAALAVLVAAGRGPLAVPRLDDLAGWVEDRGTLVAAMAVLRLLGLAAAAWLFTATVAHELARAAGATRLVLLSERALPPSVRRALGAVAGAGVLAGGIGTAVGPAVAGSADEVAVATARLEVAPPGDDAVPRPPRPQEVDGAVATMSVGPAPGLAVPAAEPPTVEEAMPAPAGAPVPSVEEWTVAPGDSFWSIAHEVVAERSAGAAAEGEVLRYWRTLVDANRHRLVGGDPDVIFPGQRLVLPG
jgi:nucleoid-associated protein YgaU